MNSQDARRAALDGTYTAGELRLLIAAKRGSGESSVLNRGMAKEAALDLFEQSLATRADEEVLVASRVDPYSPAGRPALTVDGLLIASILRECGRLGRAPVGARRRR